MIRIGTIVALLLVSSYLVGVFVGAGTQRAFAHGGATPMLLTGYTDLPDYRPAITARCRLIHRKCNAAHRD